MFLLTGGLAVLGLTSALFWYCLPRNGKTHRYVETELEPYVGVAFCSGFALSFTMIVSAAISIMGTP